MSMSMMSYLGKRVELVAYFSSVLQGECAVASFLHEEIVCLASDYQSAQRIRKKAVDGLRLLEGWRDICGGQGAVACYCFSNLSVADVELLLMSTVADAVGDCCCRRC